MGIYPQKSYNKQKDIIKTMKLRGILVRCIGTGKADVCEVSEVRNITPWGLVKSTSKCKKQMKDIGGKCKLAVAYDQETKRLIDLDKAKFKY